MSRKILYLSPYFWPEEIGSAPLCTELATWLEARGHDVKVMAFRPHYPSPDKFAAWFDGSRDRENFKGVMIGRVPFEARKQGGFKDRLANDLRFMRKVCVMALRGEFKGTQAVVAYVPSSLTLYCAKLVRFLTGAYILGIVHDIESGLANSLGLTKSASLILTMKMVERIGLNACTDVVVLSESMKEELRLIGCRKPIRVISLWATAANFAPPSVQTPTIMYSGNFGKKQNLGQLLPVMQRLSDEDVPVRIVMRGEGSEKTRFREKADGLGLKNTIFMPLAPAEELIASLQSANIHLVPQASNVSNYALPSKVYSIMSAGRPFICVAETGTPLARLAEISGAGVSIEPGDERRLFDAIVELAGDTEKQIAMGRSGQRFIEREMDSETIFREYENLIESRQ